MAKAYQEQQIEGLEVFAILSEDAQGAVPTLEYCKQYADSTGFPQDRMLIDNKFAKLFNVMANGGNGGIGLPWDGVLNGEGLIYLFNSEQGQGSPGKVVNDLLKGDF